MTSETKKYTISVNWFKNNETPFVYTERTGYVESKASEFIDEKINSYTEIFEYKS